MQLETLEQEMVLRNFSRKTISAYLFANERFLRFVRKPADEVTQADIERYLLFLAEKELAAATRHLIVSALRFYYCGVLKRRFRLVYPKVENRLPLVVQKEAVLRMIDTPPNIKHKLLITLLYSSGLRVSEAVKMKMADINTMRKCAIVRQGKGGKDRVVILSDTFLQLLEDFLPLRKRESDYIFYSDRPDKTHISIKTAEKVVENAASKVGIRAYCHALRSSFATHLLENGTDVHYVQRLLGHSSIKTTQGYLRVAENSLLKVKSPIDYPCCRQRTCAQ